MPNEPATGAPNEPAAGAPNELAAGAPNEPAPPGSAPAAAPTEAIAPPATSTEGIPAATASTAPSEDATPTQVELTKPSTAPRRGAHRASTSKWDAYRDRRQAKKDAKAKKPHRKAPWWELPALVAVAILIAILVKTFIVQPFYIPSASMEKTLAGSPDMGHDRILVNKLIYDFRDPHPGDIVVFHAPPGWNDEPTSKPPSNPILRVIRGFGQLVGVVPPDGQVLVKRVIATGGQTVWGVNDNGRSIVHIRYPDGHSRVLNEPYVFNPETDSHATFGPVTVPKGRLWVMGDHRSDSEDSRFHCLPSGQDGNYGNTCNPRSSTVPISDVIGKAFVVAWPPSHWRTLGTPPTFENSAAAAASALPGIAGAAVVVPLFITRRRRRRAR
jgi:signal peptidase I